MSLKKYTLIVCDRVSEQVIGYVQSVSYTKQTFKITPNITSAKTYTNYDKICAEIDDLTLYSGGKYIFLID